MRKKRQTRVELQRRVAKLERALRFYASLDHWGKDDWGVVSVLHGGGEYGRPGQRARKALGRPELA